MALPGKRNTASGFGSIIGTVIPLSSDRPRRADAVRNRERVLAAAEAVFAESGLKAQIEEVAHRAGVGVGTVCRHFPTKQELVEAVLTSMFESLLAQAREALAGSDPAEAFERFFINLPAFHTRHRAFAEQMANELELTALPVRNELMGAVSELVARAQAAGAIRPDIGPADVSLLFSAVAHATAIPGELQPMLRERYVRIILDGLRPNSSSVLPGQPLEFSQLRQMKQQRRR
jgi:AcrR family transcriptional regulator